MLEANTDESVALSSIRCFLMSSVLGTPGSCAEAGAGAVALGGRSDMDEERLERGEGDNRRSKMPVRVC